MTTRRAAEMDHLVNIANVLYLVSYYMKDMVWLRALTVAAAGLLIPYFWFRPEPLLAPVLWNLFFIALNLYWLARTLLPRVRTRRGARPAAPGATARPCLGCR